MPFDSQSPTDLALLKRVLGLRLRDARRLSGLTLKEAATSSGVSENYLSDCERGNRLPTVPVLVALAQTYDLLLVQLFEDLYPMGTTQRPPQMPAAPADGRRDGA